MKTTARRKHAKRKRKRKAKKISKENSPNSKEEEKECDDSQANQDATNSSKENGYGDGIYCLEHTLFNCKRCIDKYVACEGWLDS